MAVCPDTRACIIWGPSSCPERPSSGGLWSPPFLALRLTSQGSSCLAGPEPALAGRCLGGRWYQVEQEMLDTFVYSPESPCEYRQGVCVGDTGSAWAVSPGLCAVGGKVSELCFRRKEFQGGWRRKQPREAQGGFFVSSPVRFLFSPVPASAPGVTARRVLSLMTGQPRPRNGVTLD